MTTLTNTEERQAIDNITSCMVSMTFLYEISLTIQQNKNIPLIDFYESWVKKKNITDLKLPLTRGIYLGYAYVGLLYAKENWFDLVPDISLDQSDPIWGLSTYKPICPKAKNLTLRYFVKRIRNSLGHGYANAIPTENSEGNGIFDKISIQFKDVNQKDSTDTFDVTIKMSDLNIFIRNFQSIIHQHINKEQ